MRQDRKEIENMTNLNKTKTTRTAKKTIAIALSAVLALEAAPFIPGNINEAHAYASTTLGAVEIDGSRISNTTFATKEMLMSAYLPSSDNGTSKTVGLLYFGGPDANDNERQRWYIVGPDEAVNGGKDNIVIVAQQQMSQGEDFAGSVDADDYKYLDDSKTPLGKDEKYHYGESKVRARLKALVEEKFTTGEQRLMNETPVRTEDYYYSDSTNTAEVWHSTPIYYETSDKLYLLAGAQEHHGRVVYAGSNGAETAEGINAAGTSYKLYPATYTLQDGSDFSDVEYWLRTPVAPYGEIYSEDLSGSTSSIGRDLAGYVLWWDGGNVRPSGADRAYGILPVANLDISNVLFASAARISDDGSESTGLLTDNTGNYALYSSDLGMTLRLTASDELDLGSVTYDYNSITATKGTADNVYLVVQGYGYNDNFINEDQRYDFYWSKALDAGTTTVKLSEIKAAIKDSTGTGPTVCPAQFRVWLETPVEDGGTLSYAKDFTDSDYFGKHKYDTSTWFHLTGTGEDGETVTYHYRPCVDLDAAEESTAGPCDFTDKIVSDAYLKTAASCTSPATYYYACSTCGVSAKGIDETKTYTDGEALGHKYTEDGSTEEVWQINSETGEHYHKCLREVCSDREGSIKDSATHTYDQEVKTTAYIKGVSYEADGDTCYKTTTYYLSCICGESAKGKDENATFEADKEAVTGGHDYGEWVTSKDGHYKVCKNCAYEGLKDVHDYGDDGICDTCTYNGAHKCADESELVLKAEKPATCTEDGYVQHYECSGCKKLFGDKFGITELTSEDIRIEAHHTLGAEVAAKDATCTAEGNRAYYKCTECNKYFADSDASAELTEDEIKKEKVAHTFNTEDAVARVEATCTEDGNKAYFVCAVCNGKFDAEDTSKELSDSDIVIPKSGHDMIHHTQEAATCTGAGSVEYWECKNCHKNFADEAGTKELTTIVDAKTGHSMVHYAEVPATCTEDGTVEYWECANCHKYFADKDGDKEYTASDLATTKTGHHMVHHAEIPATCTEDGTVEYWECTNCNKNFADEAGTKELTTIVDAKTGHSMVHYAEVPATCTEEGTVEYWECANCHKYFADKAGTKELKESELATPKIAHNYDGSGNTCTECGYIKPDSGSNTASTSDGSTQNSDRYKTNSTGSGSGGGSGSGSVSGGGATTLNTGTVGWSADTSGSWWYTDANRGRLYGWIFDKTDARWYYVDTNKGRLYGWYYDPEAGYWYYLDKTTGEMLTGWQLIDGKQYYFAPAPSTTTYTYNEQTAQWHYDNPQALRPYGSMYADTVTPDNYRVDADGARVG